MSGQVVDHFTTTGGMTDVNGVGQIQMRQVQEVPVDPPSPHPSYGNG